MQLNLPKSFLYFKKHPIHHRLSFGYTYLTKTDVKNINIYGGGTGTFGTVTPGQKFSLSKGIEISINQKWVFACDVSYHLQGESTFDGRLGQTNSGQ